MSRNIKQSIGKKNILIAVLVNSLTYYNFSLYAFLVPLISPLFFPSNLSIISILSGFSVFALGFIARPLGGIIFGYIGDKFGRKPMLVYSSLISFMSSITMVFLPTYAEIGIWAPIFLIICRLLQCFCIGGEFCGAIILSQENARVGKKAFASSFVNSAGVVGWISASAACYILNSKNLVTLNWRVLFLIGSILAFVGFFARRYLIENFNNRLTNRQNLEPISFMDLFTKHTASLITTLSFAGLNGCLFYGYLIFSTTYLTQTVGINFAYAAKLTTLGIVFYAIALPIMGYSIDKIGNIKLFNIAIFCVIFFSLPFYLLLNTGNTALIILSLFIASILTATIAVSTTSIMIYLFPKRIRCIGTSLSYNLGSCIFGGTTPMVFSIGLLYKIGPLLSSAYIIMCAIAVRIILQFFYKKLAI